ncbi:hypothetical protein NIES2107_60360 [Nostoc carneum NIES-2107]|uniref:hypothetical protein n=1 Tax=Tolypothrix sp. PCC 7910 TaxID=2099387 RepID=UPI000B60F802|nr:hypothetical protein [Tolypothrix sp. PCC 7910]MBD2211703.1 hypothetical protein [Nostoc linckia FACHB-104]QIR39309.1 hypothetical protein HCG51_23070 [Tolypothrix sp. PCC 7910]BAY34131.1 hypothetical protein NIES2107_60360 [Nostoc carneum NIES-2107]
MSDLITSLAAGDINLLTGFVWVLIAIALSMISGAIGGIILAGKDFGYEFSAIIGSFAGPAGAVPAIILGLLWLSFLIN